MVSEPSAEALNPKAIFVGLPLSEVDIDTTFRFGGGVGHQQPTLRAPFRERTD